MLIKQNVSDCRFLIGVFLCLLRTFQVSLSNLNILLFLDILNNRRNRKKGIIGLIGIISVSKPMTIKSNSSIQKHLIKLDEE